MYLEGQINHLNCIKRYYTNGEFQCNICIDEFQNLDDVLIITIREIKNILSDYKKNYIKYKKIPIESNLFDYLILFTNVYLPITFYSSMIGVSIELKKQYYDTATYYQYIWYILRANMIVLILVLYSYLILYMDCNKYVYIHLTLFAITSVVFSFIKLHTTVIASIEMILICPIVFYTDIQEQSLIFMYSIIILYITVMFVSAIIDYLLENQLLH
jgi:hypothetical protein